MMALSRRPRHPGARRAAYPEDMSLSQPSRTIVVEPVQVATPVPAPAQPPPAATCEAARPAEAPGATGPPAQPAARP
jgi:hypothetical protein